MQLVYRLSFLNYFLLCLSHNVAIFPGNIANRYYLSKQRFLLEILQHLQEPLLHELWIDLGQQLVNDEAQYVYFNEQMHQFQKLINASNLLARDAYYNAHDPRHYQEFLGLYNLFYNTREWSTLKQNICWARLHVHPHLFLDALQQTLMKRDDYRVLIMPKIYELLPATYHNELVAREAGIFNHGNWIGQQLLYGNISRIQLVIPKRLLPTNLTGDLRGNGKWIDATTELHILSLNDRANTHQLAHLTEDVDWLAHWYYLNTGIAQQMEPLDTDKLRDWFYWQLQQLVARYQLERYGQRMAYKTWPSSEPQRLSTVLSGQHERYQPQTEATRKHFDQLLNGLEFRLNLAKAAQSYVLANGTALDLRKSHNWLIVMAELFPYDLSQLQVPVAKQPQLLVDLHTMPRDANFFQYADRLLYAYRSYRQEFQPSYQQAVKPVGLSIEQVLVGPLITYDEPVDIDLSNMLHLRHFYTDAQFSWPYTLQLRKYRLQQYPFSLQFQIVSSRTQSIILRLYLTTAAGNMREEPFYQLDSFLTIVYAGNNTIRRDSEDFIGKIGDHISYTEIYHYVLLAEREEFDFPLNITTPNCGFPRRLLLPKGSKEGLPMRLLVIATPYNYKAKQGNELNCDFSKGLSSWDELPLAYPFERLVDEEEFSGSHMHWQAIEIHHENYS